MKRSSKILLAAIAATGITFTAVSWVSAHGGWGGNCYRNNPMQGQGYGQMNPQGYGPGMGGCPMQSAKGYGANGAKVRVVLPRAVMVMVMAVAINLVVCRAVPVQTVPRVWRR